MLEPSGDQARAQERRDAVLRIRERVRQARARCRMTRVGFSRDRTASRPEGKRAVSSIEHAAAPNSDTLEWPVWLASDASPLHQRMRVGSETVGG